MAGLKIKGNQTLAGLKKRLRELPVSVAHSVAQQAAPALTVLTRTAFDSNVNVYGDKRPIGADGWDLALEVTGAAKRALQFTASGTIVRSTIGPPYLRYLIGKYKVLPNGPLPVGWKRTLDGLVASAEAPP